MHHSLVIIIGSRIFNNHGYILGFCTAAQVVVVITVKIRVYRAVNVNLIDDHSLTKKYNKQTIKQHNIFFCW